MSNLFSEHPGSRERQLKRKFNNPLFGSQTVDLLDIQEARQQDAQEVAVFMNEFRDLVQQAVALESNAEAELILTLKEQLDKSYEQCAGLAGDQAEIKQMKQRLQAWMTQTHHPATELMKDPHNQARIDEYTQYERDNAKKQIEELKQGK